MSSYLTRREEEKYEIYKEMTRYAQMWARREAAQVDMLKKALPDDLYNMIHGTEGLGLIGDTVRLDHLDLDKWLMMETITAYLLQRLPAHRMRTIILIRDAIRANIAARSRSRAAIFPVLPGEYDQMLRQEVRRQLPRIAGEGGGEE